MNWVFYQSPWYVLYSSICRQSCCTIWIAARYYSTSNSRLFLVKSVNSLWELLEIWLPSKHGLGFCANLHQHTCYSWCTNIRSKISIKLCFTANILNDKICHLWNGEEEFDARWQHHAVLPESVDSQLLRCHRRVRRNTSWSCQCQVIWTTARWN